MMATASRPQLQFLTIERCMDTSTLSNNNTSAAVTPHQTTSTITAAGGGVERAQRTDDDDRENMKGSGTYNGGTSNGSLLLGSTYFNVGVAGSCNKEGGGQDQQQQQPPTFSRRTVLKGLSDALMRRTLTKVRSFVRGGIRSLFEYWLCAMVTDRLRRAELGTTG